jgi:hypothetical protein
MELAYEAFTEACTFGLNEAGICVRVTAQPGASANTLAIAGRCLGAQYVASLDATAEGLLTQLPSPGTRLLFARAEEDGRIVLVRSGPIEHFVKREEIERDTEEREAATLSRGPEEFPEELSDTDPPADLPADLPTRRDMERAIDEAVLVDAPNTKTYEEEETVPFSRRHAEASEPMELAAVTRRSPSTLRAFPAPPARLAPQPLVRARPRHE